MLQHLLWLSLFWQQYCSGKQEVTVTTWNSCLIAFINAWNSKWYRNLYVTSVVRLLHVELSSVNSCRVRSADNALDMYLGGDRFEFLPWHRFLWQEFSWFSQSFQANVRMLPRLGYDHFHSKFPKFIVIYLSSYHPTLQVCSLDTESVVKQPAKQKI
jgi:hypothetical protein